MGGQRAQRRARCARCGLHEELCLCAEMPRLELPFEILLIQNNHERNKPTNTGRLVIECVARSERIFYAVRGERFDEAPILAPGADPRLVFPREDARELVAADLRPSESTPARVLLLDGTWGQCSRMSRRIGALAGLPAYRLPPGPPSHWGVRRTEDPARISTFEVVVRLAALAGAQEEAQVLGRFFDRLAARMLFMKGKLRSPEVPEAWPRRSGERRG